MEHWKGHDPAKFGDLLQHDVFVVKRDDVDRNYQVSLFERIILFCKDVFPVPHRDMKGGKNSFWKKSSAQAVPIRPLDNSCKRATPLALKG